ncbi:hypothetical protein LR48_Vigan07g153500 [Vigna angularis]|uniref:Uncharacterized protein n=1 Tax=Phaseolus angularis TaxID=3914 RepID=A0A0L9UYQ5_PHAAN|nr:hypothetical protein LR48_Vigan07g153500 [Vigna angularis]
MEASCALGFEPLPLFVIGFRLFSYVVLLMLCGGKMKGGIMVVLLQKMKIHDGDVGGSRIEWRNSYGNNSLKRALQHDSDGGGLAAACAWRWCEAVAAMEDGSVVVFSRLGCCGFPNFSNLARTQQSNH